MITTGADAKYFNRFGFSGPTRPHSTLYSCYSSLCPLFSRSLLFTGLFTSSYVLIRLSIPAHPADAGAWLADRAGTVSLALGLLPFAGIAFLWFIGVVRDRLGLLEDQFFATVFFGSG